MRRLLFAILAPVAVVSACAPTVKHVELAPGDADVATSLLAPGTSTVKGSALVRQQGGTVVTCAGNDVYLVPATQSAASELPKIFGGDRGYVPRGGDPVMGGGTLVVPPSPNRKGVCNAQGFFTFANVRAGRWYVLTNVTWTVASSHQGGTLLGSGEVAEGQEIELVLSP